MQWVLLAELWPSICGDRGIEDELIDLPVHDRQETDCELSDRTILYCSCSYNNRDPDDLD